LPYTPNQLSTVQPVLRDKGKELHSVVGVALVEAIQLCIRNELGSNYGKFIVQKDRYDGHVYPICRFNCTVRRFIQQRDKKHDRERKREEIEGSGYI
jgi:hypothetical protein